MSGKGDGRRPTDEKAYSDNYDRIFGKKETPDEPKDAQPETPTN